MKKISLILAVITVMLLVCSCGSGEKAGEDTGTSQEALIEGFEGIIDANEYLLYQNIFYNNMASDYDGQKQTKTGIFTTIRDEYNGIDRYYIWGYYDQTKCCDWQWEICPDGIEVFPANGSVIEISGTFIGDDKALDKYWMKDTQITVKSEYTGKQYDVNMCLMSATLERVQLVNMQNFMDKFEGKSVSAYGRILSLTHIQHPYYDSTWTQEFKTDGNVPAIGTTVVVVGKYTAGVIAESTIQETTQY